MRCAGRVGQPFGLSCLNRIGVERMAENSDAQMGRSQPVENRGSPDSRPTIEQRMVPRTNNQVYKVVVAVWLTLSVASVVLAAITWVQLSNKLAVARQAVAIREELDAVLGSLLEAETAQRGYTITGDEAFLTSLNEA